MRNLTTTILLFALTIAIGCGSRSSQDHSAHEHDSGDSVAEGGNQVLYDQVMAVHDEVMPKMNDIYTLKESLKNRITEAPAMPVEQKAELEALISRLDSASDGMMVWMRNFNPLPDSLGEEQAREYLENEMEKVQQVKTNIMEALEQGKDL